MKRNFHKLLDDTLIHIDNQIKEKKCGYYRYSNDELFYRHPFTELEHEEAVVKLIKDGYLRNEPTTTSMKYITIEGYLILENGGYSKKKRRENVELWLKIANLCVVAIAAICGIVYSCIEIQKFHSDYLLWAF